MRTFRPAMKNPRISYLSPSNLEFEILNSYTVRSALPENIEIECRFNLVKYHIHPQDLFTDDLKTKNSISVSQWLLHIQDRCPNAKSLQMDRLRTPYYRNQPPTTGDHKVESCPLTLHDLALVPTCWLVGVLLFLDLPNHKLKSLSDILVVPCTCFCGGTVEFLS
jgi:hypothetical protein